ncbi:putative non-specific lipid-transfer protein [Apostichopus japonicus]|uniref:Putative non-specific lipid-transfer protein n=1 Tax=Stichopus japonicus TaxID=307972 RepID=A0A2G8L1G9_STIJA|nr:putative non-specific lipid-transfer protein [Apostichopus japonicus]
MADQRSKTVTDLVRITKGFSSHQRQQLHIESVPTSSESFQCEPHFKLIEDQLKQEGAKYVAKVKAIYAFNVTHGPEGRTERWVVDVKNGNGSVQKGSKVKADCNFTVKDVDLVAIITGKLQAQAAYFGGKLKVKGNMGVAMKLPQIIPKHPKAKL